MSFSPMGELKRQVGFANCEYNLVYGHQNTLVVFLKCP